MQNALKIDTPEVLSLLFQPPQNNSDSVGCPKNAEDIMVPVAPEIVLNCRFYSSAPDAPTLFYFHGGTESCDTFNQEAEYYLSQEVNVFLASYRGYGQSGGTPSVSSLFTDGRILFSKASEWLKDKGFSGPLFVMGRSLGSVFAIDIAHVNNDTVKGLIIESGFCETVSLLNVLGLPYSDADLPEQEGFDILRKLAEIKLPTMIFHGAKDRLVPTTLAEKLQSFSGARNKQFFIIPGADHDTVSKTGGILYFQKIKDFINTVCGVNTWRERRKKFKSGHNGENG